MLRSPPALARPSVVEMVAQSSAHVNPRLANTLANFSGLPDESKWHFIFVVPEDIATLVCPHTEDGFLKHHAPYTASVPRNIESLLNPGCIPALSA